MSSTYSVGFITGALAVLCLGITCLALLRGDRKDRP